MKRVPPSERIRQEWNQLLCSGASGEENLLDALVRTGARYMLQMTIEQEVAEFLGRGHYQRGDCNRAGGLPPASFSSGYPAPPRTPLS
ncbi:MAG: hypothetical protein GXX09_09835 [Syntrophomonadaceae bacterium]|nr:hypothetical protein [Syntrophomonadaceae bacterium]